MFRFGAKKDGAECSGSLLHTRATALGQSMQSHTDLIQASFVGKTSLRLKPF